jgi:hypothetical protein
VETVAVTTRASRKAWARLLAKVYEIDVLQCPQCGGRMSVIAVIRDPHAIREIIVCMDAKGSREMRIHAPCDTSPSMAPPGTAPNITMHTKQCRLLNSPSTEEGVVCAFWKKIHIFALQWEQSRAIMTVEGVIWEKSPLFCPQFSPF